MFGSMIEIEAKILELFKKTLVDFFGELIQQFPTDKELILLRTFVQHQAAIEILIKKFIISINREHPDPSSKTVGAKVKTRDLIMKSDPRLFINHNLFFFCSNDDKDSHLPESRMINQDNANHFKDLWLSGVLDETDQKVVWSWLKNLVEIADKYSSYLEQRKVANK